MAEDARVAVRNIRRDANKTADAEKKAGDLSEDDADKCKEDIQKLTDQYGKQIDELLAAKSKEVMDS